MDGLTNDSKLSRRERRMTDKLTAEEIKLIYDGCDMFEQKALKAMKENPRLGEYCAEILRSVDKMRETMKQIESQIRAEE